MQTKTSIPESFTNGQGVALAPSTSLGISSAVSREVHNFLADIEDLIKATTSLTGADLERAKEKLIERVTAAKQSVEAMGGAIADRARTTAKVANGYVHGQPWQAIGIGAALGLLIGFVFARRA